MNKLIPALLVLLMCVPKMALAASPVLTYIFQQINLLKEDVNQLDTRVTTNTADINTNAINIGINTSNINTSTSDLQQQIDVLVTQINILEAQPKLPNAVDGNSEVIGSALGYQCKSTDCNEISLHVLTSNGYSVFVQSTGSFGAYIQTEALYLTPDCTGTAYIDGFFTAPGIVIGGGFLPGLYYTPLEASFTDITAQSLWVGSCVPSTASLQNALPFYVNDPAITGVPLGSYVGPVHIEAP